MQLKIGLFSSDVIIVGTGNERIPHPIEPLDRLFTPFSSDVGRRGGSWSISRFCGCLLRRCSIGLADAAASLSVPFSNDTRFRGPFPILPSEAILAMRRRFATDDEDSPPLLPGTGGSSGCILQMQKFDNKIRMDKAVTEPTAIYFPFCVANRRRSTSGAGTDPPTARKMHCAPSVCCPATKISSPKALTGDCNP